MFFFNIVATDHSVACQGKGPLDQNMAIKYSTTLELHYLL